MNCHERPAFGACTRRFDADEDDRGRGVLEIQIVLSGLLRRCDGEAYSSFASARAETDRAFTVEQAHERRAAADVLPPHKHCGSTSGCSETWFNCVDQHGANYLEKMGRLRGNRLAQRELHRIAAWGNHWNSARNMGGSDPPHCRYL
eukprot:3213754-Rhodomonas_salina.1